MNELARKNPAFSELSSVERKLENTRSSPLLVMPNEALVTNVGIKLGMPA